MNLELDKKFKEAFKKISETQKSIPPDILLRLYAYYKQTKKEDSLSIKTDNTEPDLRNAFKFNARIQLKGMSEEDAKKEYIQLANKILK